MRGDLVNSRFFKGVGDREGSIRFINSGDVVAGFIRIHRPVIVNSAFVEEIRPPPTGEYGLRIKGEKEYTVTRTFKENLKSLAEFWIGSECSFATKNMTDLSRTGSAKLSDMPIHTKQTRVIA